MNFSILNWNIGGAKFLETRTKGDREEFRENINTSLRKILKAPGLSGQVDIVTLQEIVRYQEPDQSDLQEIIDPIKGYTYVSFTLIDTKQVSVKAKWRKILSGSDWHADTYFGQGNGFLLRDNLETLPVWDLSALDQTRPGTSEDHFIEHIHLDSGLYFGDRNTEPRAALVAHFVYDPTTDPRRKRKKLTKKPLDIFVVNLHLTTLMMEREGVPEIDRRASRIRRSQLSVVFDGIVSRYNSWRRSGYLQRGERVAPEPSETYERYSPVWILAGDFNFTPESGEYAFVRQMNFIDTILPDKKKTEWGTGTKAKGVGEDPTLTLDYVFAGPKFVSLDPVIEEKGLGDNRVIHDHNVRASDHYPLAVTLSFEPVTEK